MCMNKKFDVPRNFTLTWHAGAMNTEANTLPSLKTALDGDADVAELDVSFLPDGTPVIIHNNNPTDVNLPKLEDALKLTAEYEKTALNLDLKSVANVKAVDELVKKYGLENRAFYTGVSEEWIADVKAASSLPYYINVSPTASEKTIKSKADALVKKYKAMGVAGINIHFINATPVFREAVRLNGLPISVWTPSDNAEIAVALSLYPENLTTRRPDLVKEFLK